MKSEKFKNKKFATKAIHSGFHHCEQTGAVMPPIYNSTTYAQTAPGQPIGEFEYSRTNNPTRSYLEANLAAIENGQHGFCFASGCAALQIVLSMLPRDAHVIVSDDVYGGTLRLFNIFQAQGMRYSLVDLTNIDQLENDITADTQLIWLETPSNPLLKIIDIAAIKNKIAKRSILLAVDNTFATPYLQNPLDLGADIVCHSTTKYIGGHSDTVGGALIVNDVALAEKIAYMQNALGPVPSPTDCYYLLRSTKTLAVRMERHCLNAMKIAQVLQRDLRISKVIYPGLETHPQFKLAQQQMRGFGGMMSVVLKGNQAETIRFLQKLEIFTLAESLGGVESLIEHPATMTHAAIPVAHRQKIGIAESMVRISVGIEDVDDLIADLVQALAA